MTASQNHILKLQISKFASSRLPSKKYFLPQIFTMFLEKTNKSHRTCVSELSKSPSRTGLNNQETQSKSNITPHQSCCQATHHGLSNRSLVLLHSPFCATEFSSKNLLVKISTLSYSVWS